MPKKGVGFCTIKLLDGKDLSLDVHNIKNPIKTCNDLLDQVCEATGIEERKYFGFTFAHPKDDKNSWIDLEKPLQRQLKKAHFLLQFSVQFYPASMQMIKGEVTKYNFVLHIRKQLLTGALTCTLPSQALLASYIVQGEFGNYKEEIHNNQEYLKDLVFMPSQPHYFLQNVQLFHKQHHDILPAEADSLYLEAARKISSFGMDSHTVMDEDSNTLVLGADICGIHVFHQKVKLHTFCWSFITRIASHGRELMISLKINVGTKTEEGTIGFVCSSQTDSNRLARSFSANKQHFADLHRPEKQINTDSKVKDSPSSETQTCEHTEEKKSLEHGSEYKVARVSSSQFSKLIGVRQSPSKQSTNVVDHKIEKDHYGTSEKRIEDRGNSTIENGDFASAPEIINYTENGTSLDSPKSGDSHTAKMDGIEKSDGEVNITVVEIDEESVEILSDNETTATLDADEKVNSTDRKSQTDEKDETGMESVNKKSHDPVSAEISDTEVISDNEVEKCTEEVDAEQMEKSLDLSSNDVKLSKDECKQDEEFNESFETIS